MIEPVGGLWWREGKLVRTGWGRIPPEYASAVEPTHPILREWTGKAKAPEGKNSVLISGPTGTSKTYQVIAAVRSVVNDFDNLVFTTGADMFSTLRMARGNQETFEIYERADVLAIDDFGQTDEKSDWLADLNYRLINYRGMFHLPTLVTTNAKLSEIETRFGGPITSRLRGMCAVAVFTGEDKRVDRRAQ